MIELIADMPPNTFGFRGSGKFSKDDYTEVLIPPLREAIERGEKMRMLFQIGPDFHGVEADAVWTQAKADLGLGIRHLSAWERIALVTDEEWVGHAIGLVGWLYPCEMRIFSLDELEAAKEWLAA
jgi:hypothetical protein